MHRFLNIVLLFVFATIASASGPHYCKQNLCKLYPLTPIYHCYNTPPHLNLKGLPEEACNYHSIKYEMHECTCCSWHGGVCVCNHGTVMCCDGTFASDCGC